MTGSSEHPDVEKRDPSAAEGERPEAGGGDEIENRPMSLPAKVGMTVALMSAVLLVALDVNIIATALPTITVEYRRLDHVAWYGAAFQLSRLTVQPLYGKLALLFPIKPVFYIANGILMVGSLICALAPKSEILIFGRAVQGCGAAGIMSTILSMVSFTVSKKDFPFYISLISSMFTVASLVGPVLGGVFAESYLTWRFCFWINLPVSFVSVSITLFAFPEPRRRSVQKKLSEKLQGLDPLGTFLLLGSLTALVLALQWGGVSMPWSDSRVWGCFISFGLCSILFMVVQIRQKELALIPMRIFTHRVVASSCTISTFLMIGINVQTTYLPFWLQASRGFGAQKSGLLILPLAASNPISALLAGAIATRTGHYIPLIFSSGAITAVGYGLLSTLTTGSTMGQIIGFQLIAGIGFGFGVHLPLTAMRHALSDEDMPIANSLLVFFQSLGNTLSQSGGQAIFLGMFTAALAAELPQAEVQRISELGAGDVDAEHVGRDLLKTVVEAYGVGMEHASYLAVASSCAAFICALGLIQRRIGVRATTGSSENR